MNEKHDAALLPQGLHDDLMPEAEAEGRVTHDLLSTFAAHGYDRVKPPLLEFEEALLAGPGGAKATQMFRLMDPLSQRMMAIRNDMTPQIARIAATQLADAPRPLRLCYGGQVVKVKGSQVHPERQFTQAGAELIGSGQRAADVEIILLAAESLSAAGVQNLSIDLTLPPLVPAICKAYGLNGELTKAARQALDAKDAAALKDGFEDAGPILAGLLEALGPVDGALKSFESLDLPDAVADLRSNLLEIVELVRAAAPDLTLTMDPGEYRGFEYQTGVCFSFFSHDSHVELGRGGRYTIGPTGDGDGETATGFTIEVDSLMRAIGSGGARLDIRKLYLPYGTSPAQGARMRAEGWRTVSGLEPTDDSDSAARTLGCSHLLQNTEVVEAVKKA